MEAAENYAGPYYKWLDRPVSIRNSVGMDISYSPGGIGFCLKNYSYNKKLYVIVYIHREDGAVENYILEGYYVEPLGNGYEKWQIRGIPIYPYHSPHGKAIKITFSFLIHKDGSVFPSFYEYKFASFFDLERCNVGLNDFREEGFITHNSFTTINPLHPATLQMAWREINHSPDRVPAGAFFTRGNTDSRDHPRHEIHRLLDMVIERKKRDPWGRHYIHIALFNFDNPYIAEHLLYACREGVEVECIGGWEQLSSLDWIESISLLRKAGIPLYGVVRNIPHDYRGGIGSMHTKIINFDGEASMTASFNLDFHIWGANWENAIFHYSPHIAILYENIYHAVKGTGYIPVQINPDCKFNSYYSFSSCPAFDGKNYKAEDIIIKEIRRARWSIVVVMFDIDYLIGVNEYGERTSTIDELTGAKWRGLDVKVILNGIKAEEGELPEIWDKDKRRPLKEPVSKLIDGEVEVFRVYNHWDIYSPLHHKFAVFDGETVMGGSYNWYSVSTVSDEEMVVIKDRELAGNFLEEASLILEKLRVKYGYE